MDALALQDSTSSNALTFVDSNELKTIRFTEDNVHDFAWFADKRWFINKDTVTIPGNPEVITIWTAGLTKKYWRSSTNDLKHTVKYYSKWVGPYPYKTIKACEGDMKAGGGMEYPTVTVIDRNMKGNATVLTHEAGHNWFYGILASNERDHAWMDEGLNSFYEQKTMQVVKSASGRDTSRVTVALENLESGSNAVIYKQLANSRKDQAIAQTSNNFTELNYGMDVYYKSALMLGWLEDYMGAENFEAGMHDYFNTWKFRHPYPEDFRAVLEKHTDKPIGWFFEDILHTDQPIDFKLKKVQGNTAVVKNKTALSIPVKLDVYQGDSLLAGVWSAPFTGSAKLSLPPAADNWSSVKVSSLIPDGRTANDRYKRSGFHRFPLKPAPFVGLNTGNSDKVWFSPSLGYNMYDG
jgi:hypothetical protein